MCLSKNAWKLADLWMWWYTVETNAEKKFAEWYGL